MEGSPEHAVAEQVRRRRLALGLSNGELAARAGISKAMLSKIEHRRTSCSLSTLARLAGALSVPVGALLGELEPAPDAVSTAGGTPERRLEAHVVTLPGEAGADRDRHRGPELLCVLEGAMVYGYEDARYTLRPGDVLQLDREGEHGPYELLEAPVRFLSVVSRA